GLRLRRKPATRALAPARDRAAEPGGPPFGRPRPNGRFARLPGIASLGRARGRAVREGAGAAQGPPRMRRSRCAASPAAGRRARGPGLRRLVGDLHAAVERAVLLVRLALDDVGHPGLGFTLAARLEG